MSQPHYFHSQTDFQLENGAVLPGIDICYHTWGKMNEAKNNVIWICHAFTANSDAESWWPGMIGKGCLWDQEQHFIVCANIRGSCYGTTGPLSINAITGKPFYLDFPALTVRDLVAAHELLRKHLEIDKIHTVVGGSVGAQQSMEWAIMRPETIQHLIIIAANAQYSPWAIAFNEAQRLALAADPSFFDLSPTAGQKGLQAARSIAMLSYRNHRIYNQTQTEEDPDKTDNFKASSYQQYQGNKLVKRFNAHSYFVLTRLLDTHNVGRNRGGVIAALNSIKAKTLVIGIASDLLFPVEEQQFIAGHVTDARYVEIESLYGHDGFLIETTPITKIIRLFYQS